MCNRGHFGTTRTSYELPSTHSLCHESLLAVYNKAAAPAAPTNAAMTACPALTFAAAPVYAAGWAAVRVGFTVEATHEPLNTVEVASVPATLAEVLVAPEMLVMEVTVTGTVVVETPVAVSVTEGVLVAGLETEGEPESSGERQMDWAYARAAVRGQLVNAF